MLRIVKPIYRQNFVEQQFLSINRTLKLKIDEYEFKGENSHDETSGKKCFAFYVFFRTIPLLTVDCFSKYNKFWFA